MAHEWGKLVRFPTPAERFDTKDLCIQHVQHLPFAATVDMADGRKFHLVHAEFDDVEPINDSDLVERMPQLMEECCIDGPFLCGGVSYSQHYIGVNCVKLK